ncbi:hypothetical protein ACO0QE_003011 [Hanseniaspora vineae]
MSKSKYNHPYQPYDIQVDLMDAIYKLLDSPQESTSMEKNISEKVKKIGIFESPTGTGKTLSLVCSTLTWLRNNKEHLLLKTSKTGLADSTSDAQTENKFDDDDDEPDWIVESYNKTINNERLHDFKDFETRIQDFNKKKFDAEKLNTPKSNAHLQYKKRKVQRVDVDIETDENQFLLHEYHDGSTENTNQNLLANQVKYLLDKFDQPSSLSKKTSVDITNSFKQPKQIVFASRTHSQLQQFASQLNLPTFPSSFGKDILSNETIKYLPLGSRKQLCCNDKIQKLTSIDLVNEGCQDAIKTSSCEYYQNQDTILQKFPPEAIFRKINDIEEVQSMGKTFQTCPYYASRKATHFAEIISVPYQLLLNNNSRNSINLDLSNAIVIIDEAHNLIDTILNLNKCKITSNDFMKIIKSLKTYLNRFNRKLNPTNRLNLMKLLKFLTLIQDFITKNYKKNMKINPNDILQHGNLDVYNFNELVEFIRATKLAYKLQSYINNEELKMALKTAIVDQSNHESIKKTTLGKGQPVLFKIVSFIECLRNPSYEGIFYFTQEQNTLEYMLLEPSEFFKPIVDNCYKLILCGGTMEPMKEFTEKLFPYVPETEILKFSCNHVIPDSNLKVFTLKSDFINHNTQYEFTFAKKNNPEMLESLGSTLFKLFSKVPMGTVVFVQSYEYLHKLVSFWKANGQFEKLSNVKNIFYEKPNSESDPWKEYSNNIMVNKKPSCLFAVVGGKLSEGINFQDDLARAVILLGLPYPNILSSDMVIQRNHIFKKNPAKGKEIFKNYIDMICMRSVNQSVGRAIRHINDYAAIYLVDKRFGNSDVQAGLSQWVKRRIISPEKNIMQETEQFFALKK